MVSVYPLLKEDYNNLTFFLSDFPNDINGKDFWLRRLFFWWDNNPAFSEGLPRGWVLKDNEKIVGFIGCIPTLFQLSGEEIAVFNTTTWRVLPEYRGVNSINLFYREIDAAKNTVLFCTTPGENIVKTLKFLGLYNIFDGSIKKYFFINLRSILQKKLARLWLSKQIVGLISPIIRLFNFLILKKTSRAYKIRELNQADNSLDKLWQELKGRYQNTNVRTSEVLNWYCFGNPDLKKLLLACYDDTDELLGYLICMDFEHKNTKRLICVDFFGYPDTKILNSLINKALSYTIESNYDAFIFPCFNNTLDGLLKKTVLFRRRGISRHFFKLSSTLLNKIKNSESYFVGAQGDFGL